MQCGGRTHQNAFTFLWQLSSNDGAVGRKSHCAVKSEFWCKFHRCRRHCSMHCYRGAAPSSSASTTTQLLAVRQLMACGYPCIRQCKLCFIANEGRERESRPMLSQRCSITNNLFSVGYIFSFGGAKSTSAFSSEKKSQGSPF